MCIRDRYTSGAVLEKQLLEKLFSMGNNDHHTTHGITGDPQRRSRRQYIGDTGQKSHSRENSESSGMRNTLQLSRLFENLKENFDPQIYDEIRSALHCKTFDFFSESLDLKNIHTVKRLEGLFDMAKLQELIARRPELVAPKTEKTTSQKKEEDKSLEYQRPSNTTGERRKSLQRSPLQLTHSGISTNRPMHTPPGLKFESELSYFMSPSTLIKDYGVYYESPPTKRIKVETLELTPNMLNISKPPPANSQALLGTNRGKRPEETNPRNTLLMSGASFKDQSFYANSFLYSPMGLKFESPSKLLNLSTPEGRNEHHHHILNSFRRSKLQSP
eukprot:TRINITY_DN287_c0_g3_i1.p1 TRINITY_DN287_c0_g3~~TRINITY_DN287_c0_g3_i1.p1  ORF type:complete len:331 (+),score=88.75 TRINITY_DN287_c0_g3_i1:67-1059(+)